MEMSMPGPGHASRLRDASRALTVMCGRYKVSIAQRWTWKGNDGVIMNRKLQTAIFLLVVGGVFIFLLMAPESTTPRMPLDGRHEARQKDFTVCFECHPPGELPENHTVDGKVPPTGKQKCYFCHKLDKED